MESNSGVHLPDLLEFVDFSPNSREERKEKSEEKMYPLAWIYFEKIGKADTISFLFSLLSLLWVFSGLPLNTHFSISLLQSL